MLAKKPPLHVLLLNSSQNQAEKIVSLLRNGGHATRAHRITSSEDLEDSLSNQAWDLFIARQSDGDITYQSCLQQITKLEKDIPTIVLVEEITEESAVSAMRCGARDILPVSIGQRLMMVVDRELRDLDSRRKQRSVASHLRDAEKRCNILLESSMDAIAYISEGMHVYANQAYLELFICDDIDDMMCIPIMDLLAPASTEAFKVILKKFTDGVAEKEIGEKELLCTIKKSDGEELDVAISFSQATYDGETCTQIIVRPEVDPELEEKLRKFSSEDQLTGLYNRIHFNKHLDAFVEKAIKSEVKGCLLYIELRHFDDARDEYGITAADTILSEVAAVLKKLCDENHLVARMGDDTYGVLAPDIDGKMGEQLAAKLCKTIADHLFEVEGKTVQVSARIGLVRIDENSPTAPDLLSRAYKACTHVDENAAGANSYYLYNSLDFASNTNGRSEDMMLALQQALDNNQFRLLFQPIIGLRGESEEHYEAFVRLLNNDNEEISPDKFLPFNNNADLATKLDRWVILQTIKSLGTHRSQGHDSRLFLNITPFTITDKTFLDWLGVALKAANLPGASLIFQFNEENAIQFLKQAKEFSEGIRRFGCQLSLSRFGCALNPFNTLKHVNADYIKLDGSFTEEIQKNDASKESLKDMVTQIQALDKLTIVPFVENASVLSTLWQAGVNYIQGYYLQEPSAEMNYDFNDDD